MTAPIVPQLVTEARAIREEIKALAAGEGDLSSRERIARCQELLAKLRQLKRGTGLDV